MFIFTVCSRLIHRQVWIIWICILLVIIFGVTTLWQLVLSLKNFDDSTMKIYHHVPKSRQSTQISYSVESLPAKDFTRLVDLENFRFLSSHVCNDTDQIDLLIFVQSAPKNFERRNAIRETWGQTKDGIKLFFMLGGVDNQTLQDQIDKEYRKHSDVVQGNFMDSYRNLTYKFIMGFKYTLYFCPNAQYVLKTDDDIFVNIPTVLEYLQLLPKDKKNFIFCSVMDGSPAIRKPSKWQVPYGEYPHRSYPQYCSGFAVMFTKDVIFRIYREAQRGEFFWVDDAFVTG